MKVLTLFVLSILVAGCVTTKTIVRPDEARRAINFESEGARDTFNCTLSRIRSYHPLDNKQDNESTASLTDLIVFKREYYLSDSAYFNFLLDKTDSNRDAVISKPEANALYKIYFPSHAYIEVGPNGSFFQRASASVRKPRCDIR